MATDYPRRWGVPAYSFGRKKRRHIYVHYGLQAFIGPSVATYGSANEAFIDYLAFEMLFSACGGYSEEFDKARFERYLRAITNFEICWSNNVRRHLQRTSTECEIIRVLSEHQYFTKPSPPRL
jgi:hypothetical protein